MPYKQFYHIRMLALGTLCSFFFTVFSHSAWSMPTCDKARSDILFKQVFLALQKQHDIINSPKASAIEKRAAGSKMQQALSKKPQTKNIEETCAPMEEMLQILEQ